VSWARFEAAKIAANANSTAQQKAFAQGMEAAVERFQAALKTAEQAAQVRDLPPQGGH
jgi:predicted outer membrane protein